MGISFLHFMESTHLLDRFFETSAEKLFLTRTEFASLGRLTRKGYLSTATVRRLRSQKLIEAIPEPARRGSVEDTIHASVQPAVDAFRRLKLKFMISEDATLRKRLKGTGVRVISTVDIIAHMAKKGSITTAEATQAIDALRAYRWYDGKVLDAVQRWIQEAKR